MVYFTLLLEVLDPTESDGKLQIKRIHAASERGMYVIRSRFNVAWTTYRKT